jgi:DNA-binding transcriptional MerR regulator
LTFAVVKIMMQVMNQLQAYAQNQSRWSLDEFVQIANRHLPDVLPEEKTNTRVRGDVTPRLVRHYTTLNMLDEPLKEGREARYGYRHLLQILVLRRLLAEGHSAGAIDQLITTSRNSELEALLQGGVQLSAAPTNLAMAHLQRLQRQQAILAEPPTEIGSGDSEGLRSPSAQQWTRLEVLTGLELHVRDDFCYPDSPQAQAELLQYLAQQLSEFRPSRRSSP